MNIFFIPVINTFRRVADKYYGGYWHAFQSSSAGGNTLSYDTTHLNDNNIRALLIFPFDF